MNIRRVLLAATISAGLSLGLALPAHASEIRPSSLSGEDIQAAVDHHFANLSAQPVQPKGSMAGTDAVGDTYRVSVTGQQYGTESPDILTSCRNPGATCSLSRAVTMSATVSGGFGLSAGAVSAQAGLSYSVSVSDTVSCTSPVLGYNQLYIARPSGTFVFYNVDRYNLFGFHTGTERGTAFFPTGVSCRVIYG
ncbi:hypothetical protein [Pseudarthrobacter equi]|nr:hypothetical protein [Pseudarthrobacter equi]